MSERIERIKKMEQHYDSLLAAADKGAQTIAQYSEQLAALKDYMDSGLWLSDYEADERGELPPELKRGVLSQDGVYNLLCEIEQKRCTAK